MLAQRFGIKAAKVFKMVTFGRWGVFFVGVYLRIVYGF